MLTEVLSLSSHFMSTQIYHVKYSSLPNMLLCPVCCISLCLSKAELYGLRVFSVISWGRERGLHKLLSLTRKGSVSSQKNLALDLCYINYKFLSNLNLRTVFHSKEMCLIFQSSLFFLHLWRAWGLAHSCHSKTSHYPCLCLPLLKQPTREQVN